MNICFVSKEYPIDGNYDSGIGRYLYELTSELKKKNRVVILTTSDKPRVIKSKNLTIYATKYPDSKKRSIAFMRHLINVALLLTKIINKEGIRIIEFANWESEGILFTSLINKFLKIPVVVRLHTPSAIDRKFINRPEYFSEKLIEFCEKVFVNQRDIHLATSTHFNAKECKKNYEVKNKPIEIIPLGIKPHKILSPITNHQSQITVLFVGRLEPRKGIDILVKAIPKVLSKVTNVRFLIAGSDNAPKDWIDDLKNSIQYQYLSHVNFLGYIKDQKTLSRLYSNADICVIPSRYESFGLTVLDAMSYGKAVIASRVGGIPEIITNCKNGLLFNPQANDLSSTLLKLLLDRKLRSQLSHNAYYDSKHKYHSSQMVKKSLGLYSRIL